MKTHETKSRETADNLMGRNQWFQCPVQAMGTGSVFTDKFNGFQTCCNGSSVTGTEDLLVLDWNKRSTENVG